MNPWIRALLIVMCLALLVAVFAWMWLDPWPIGGVNPLTPTPHPTITEQQLPTI